MKTDNEKRLEKYAAITNIIKIDRVSDEQLDKYNAMLNAAPHVLSIDEEETLARKRDARGYTGGGE